MRAERREERFFLPALGAVLGAAGFIAGTLAAGLWAGLAGLGLGAASTLPLSRVMRR